MKNGYGSRSAVVVLLALAAVPAHVAANGTVQQLAGTVSVQKADGSLRMLSRSSAVVKGDTLNTERDSYAQVQFSDGAIVTLKPNTRMRIEDYVFEQVEPIRDNSAFALLKGGLRMVTGLIGKRGNQDALRVGTVTATIGIRGTTFSVDDCLTTTCARRGAGRASAFAGSSEYAAVGGSAIRDISADDSARDEAAAAQPPTASSSTPRDPFDAPGNRLAQSSNAANELEPGVYVSVTAGEIIVSNSAGSERFGVGQFGAVANFNSRPSVLPGDPGLPTYQPPVTFFQAISGSGVRNALGQCFAN